jgi:hypothetical protein
MSALMRPENLRDLAGFGLLVGPFVHQPRHQRVALAQPGIDRSST